MKLGIITDIHSNIYALKAVLAEFNKIKVDKIICCGDIVGVGINPEETVQELLNLGDNLISVRGNHEQYLLKGLPQRVHNNKRNMSKEEIENHKWNHSKLSEESKKFLSNLKLCENIEIGTRRVYIVHYPKENDGTFKKYIKNPTIIENKENFKDIDADIFLFGHTHEFSVNSEDNKWYINTGSLGCPMKSNIAKAGILEIDEYKIEFKKLEVEYDVKEIVEKIKLIKFPFYKEILEIFYGM